MLLHLTDLSSEPLNRQIFKQLRAKILSGELSPGHDLPSIRVMAREQHVSVITIQSAYELLQREKLIHSRRGKGFFVSDLTNSEKREIAQENLSEKLQAIVAEAMEEGLTQDEITQIFDRITGSVRWV